MTYMDKENHLDFTFMLRCCLIFWLTFLGDIGKTNAHLMLSVGLHTIYFNQIVMGNFPFGNHKNQQKLDKNQLKFVASPSTSMGSITLLPQPILPEPSPEFDPSGYHVYVSFCLRRPTLTTNNISNWIECYDPSNNTWSYVSLIPGTTESHVLNGSAMVSLQDSIYIIGGQLCYKEMVHVSDELAELVDVEVEVLSTVLRYSVGTNQWSTCAPLQTPCWDFACTVCDHKIYVAGGQSTSSSARGIPSAKVYDPTLDERSSLPGMSTSRYKCAGVTWNGKVHMIGGYDKRLHSGCAIPFIVEQSSVEVYDPRTGRWELMARMWQLDVPPNQILALDDGRLLSSGDCLMAWKGYIIAYDPQFNLWDIVPGSLQRTLISSGGHVQCQRPQVTTNPTTVRYDRTDRDPFAFLGRVSGLWGLAKDGVDGAHVRHISKCRVLEEFRAGRRGRRERVLQSLLSYSAIVRKYETKRDLVCVKSITSTSA